MANNVESRPLFHEDTKFATRSEADGGVHKYAYFDMRGFGWYVDQHDANSGVIHSADLFWQAFPSNEAMAKYNIPGTLFAQARDANALIDAIEERLEAMRASEAAEGRKMLWMVAALAVLAVMSDRKR